MDARLNCPSCGNRYLPPPREGTYLCPVCRGRLPQRSALQRKRWLAGRAPALVLGTLFLIAAGGVTVRGRAASTVAARALVEPEPEVSFAAVRVEARRQDRAIRALHRRELRRHPVQSQPHAWAAYDLLRDLMDRAQLALPSLMGRGSAPMSEFTRQRQVFEQRQVQLEKYIATHFARDAARAVRHAEKAFRFAANPIEEMQSRRLLGDAYRIAGRYDSALRQYLWLTSVEQYGDRGMLFRCFVHKGQNFRPEFRDGSYWVRVGDGMWPIGSRSARPYIEATQKWVRRWPESSFLRSRLGKFYYDLAMQTAQEHPDFPQPGRDFGKRVDACIYRHAGPSVEEGMRHFQAARELAQSPWELARALSELGHGYLTRAQYARAIPLLKEALAQEPWNRSAQDYLRQAYRRWGRGQDRVQTSLRPPPGWYVEGMGLPMLNSTFFGPGLGYARLTTEQAAEARELIARLQRGASLHEARAAQEARNRLDELLPGAGRSYNNATGDVRAVDLEHALARLERLQRIGAVSPALPTRYTQAR